MGNKITEKYFVHENFADRQHNVLNKIVAKTHFTPEKEIFRGQIYDTNKVGSLIYKGVWHDTPAVLKIQGLRPEVDEIDVINKFNKQNESKMIRLPRLYDGVKWNEKDGYGYLLLEYIDAPRIYKPPFATREQIDAFCALYQEYKTKCLRKPFFAQEPNEYSSLVFTTQRVSHWAKISQTKQNLTTTNIATLETFLSLAGKHLPSLRMEFMHGHFTYDDIFAVSDTEYVVMSNLFWSYRPEYYDATFHLWAGIKSVRDQGVTTQQVLTYLDDWLKAYQGLPTVQRDVDFERKFNMMMAERSVGALLVDVHNQYYEHNREKAVTHLIRLFQDIFLHFAAKLEKASPR